MLQSMGLQRVRRDWATKLKWLTEGLPLRQPPSPPTWVPPRVHSDVSSSGHTLATEEQAPHALGPWGFSFPPSLGVQGAEHISGTPASQLETEIGSSCQFSPPTGDQLLIFNFYLCIYLAALGLSCGTWNLHCIMWALSSWHMGSRACGLSGCSVQA